MRVAVRLTSVWCCLFDRKLIATVELQQKNMSSTPMEQYQANCEQVQTSPVVLFLT